MELTRLDTGDRWRRENLCEEYQEENGDHPWGRCEFRHFSVWWSARSDWGWRIVPWNLSLTCFLLRRWMMKMQILIELSGWLSGKGGWSWEMRDEQLYIKWCKTTYPKLLQRLTASVPSLSPGLSSGLTVKRAHRPGEYLRGCLNRVITAMSKWSIRAMSMSVYDPLRVESHLISVKRAGANVREGHL